MIRKESLIARLAAVVGNEHAEEILDRTAQEVGATGPHLDEAQLARVLETLCGRSDVVGMTARLLKNRVPTPQPRFRPAAAPATTAHAETLIGMLTASLGRDKAESLVADAIKRRGFTQSALTSQEAHAILEDLAKSKGLVGTVARFAKARAHFELTSSPTIDRPRT
jgi:hypothetical protein